MNSRVEVNFTATSGQTTFTTPYEVGQIDVYYNGSKLNPSEFTATNGTDVVLAQAAILNAQISIVKYIGSINGSVVPTSRTLTINGVTFDLSADRTWTVEGGGGIGGTLYSYLAGDGTPTENGAALTAAYTAAKAILGLSATNRFKIIVGTGKYQITGQFPINTEFIDFVSLTGDADVEITNGITVTANNVFLKGLVSGLKSALQSFQVATNLNLLICENCQGGTESFGSSGTASGTFTNCNGGEFSFGSNGTASGTFTNCNGGEFSFGSAGTASGTFTNCTGGYGSFGGAGTASGTFTNCTGGDESFGSNGTASGTFTNCNGGEFSFGGLAGTASGTFTNCTGGYGSFGWGFLSGKLYYCRLTTGTFSTVSSGGRTYYCVDGNGNPNNQ
jgi:hypothetical protein